MHTEPKCCRNPGAFLPFAAAGPQRAELNASPCVITAGTSAGLAEGLLGARQFLDHLPSIRASTSTLPCLVEICPQWVQSLGFQRKGLDHPRQGFPKNGMSATSRTEKVPSPLPVCSGDLHGPSGPWSLCELTFQRQARDALVFYCNMGGKQENIMDE